MSEAIAPLSLYDITAELRALEADLLESGGEITAELEEKYSGLLQMEESKVEGYLRMIRRFEATAEAIEAEEKRLAAARKTMQNAAKGLKDRLAYCMQQRGSTEHLTSIGKVKLQRSGTPPLLLKVPVDELPAHFRRVKVEADMVSLRSALKNGDAAEYAEFGEPSVFIRIY